MTGDEKDRDDLEQDRGTPAERDAGAPAKVGDGAVKDPEPEEVPELLGERSDCPIPSRDDR